MIKLNILQNYSYISSLLLVILVYASYEDLKSRKVTTLTFLIMDVILMIYYVFINCYISILLIPVIGEYYIKKFSILPYALIAIPVLLDPNIIVISISYSILLIKIFSIVIKNLGRGDIKILQTISAAFPIYPHLRIIYSILPPVIVVMLIASLIGIGSGMMLFIENRKEREFRWKFTSIPLSKVKQEYKYWIKNDRAVYKIPFVAFITFSYTIILILSLLQLV